MSKEYIKEIRVISTVPNPADVYLTSDFEGSDRWHLNDWYAFDCGKDPAAAFLGTYGYRLKTRVAGSLATDTARITRLAGVVRSRFVEFYFKFQFATVDKGQKIEAHFQCGDPDNITTYAVKYDLHTKKWYCLIEADTWQEITGLTYTVPINVWVSVRLIVDVINRKYRYIDLGLERADLKNIPGWVADNPNRWTASSVMLYVRNHTAVSNTIYFDQIFVRAVSMP